MTTKSPPLPFPPSNLVHSSYIDTHKQLLCLLDPTISNKEMKVPFTTPQNLPKQVNHNHSGQNTALRGSGNLTNLFSEPNSVLDVRRSPSPTSGKQDISVLPQYYEDPLQLIEHGMNQFEDWESLMRELGLNDDSTPASALCEFPLSHSFDPTAQLSTGFEFVDDLIRLSDCFDTNSVQLAHGILARLNQRLPSPNGKPLRRAAFYFKEALQSLLTGATRLTRPSNSSEVVQAIKAYNNFINISPIPMFSSFTANQALLEALEGSMFVHVIDFDIGLGGHWASFMKELAINPNQPVLRITAVVQEQYGTEMKLIRENLFQFARELDIGFDIEFVSVRTFEFMQFKAIKFVEGEKTGVLLSPMIFRQIGAGFVQDLRRICPDVVVHVDCEGLMGDGGTRSFRETVIEGLEFYSTVMESLEPANLGGGDFGKLESHVVVPKIVAAVEAAGQLVKPWREAFANVGMRPVGLSYFSDFQAECLVRRVQVRGFHVLKRQAEMVLCWHDRALVTTSAWTC